VEFEKWHALGNAYLLVEGGALTAERVRRLCDVRVGIGADGVVEVTGVEGARIRLEVTARNQRGEEVLKSAVAEGRIPAEEP